MAIVCVNHINLPQDLLIVIKDYAFLTPERKRLMQAFALIHSIINDALTKYTNPEYFPQAWFYWIQKKSIHCFKKNQFVCVFCIHCGNYLPRYYNEYRIVVNCSCN